MAMMAYFMGGASFVHQSAYVRMCALKLEPDEDLISEVLVQFLWY